MTITMTNEQFREFVEEQENEGYLSLENYIVTKSEYGTLDIDFLKNNFDFLNAFFMHGALEQIERDLNSIRKKICSE